MVKRQKFRAVGRLVKKKPLLLLLLRQRLSLLNVSSFCLEEVAWQKGYLRVAGVDEAGRGPLAGPVVAAACILPKEACPVGLKESKQLSPQARQRFLQELQSHPSVVFGLGLASEAEIDALNIYQATLLAMQRAVVALTERPDYLLVDAMPLEVGTIPYSAVIRGDEQSFSIAAASLLAKETRDAGMREAHEKWPQYGFDRHKGYGTRQHLEALAKWGPCPLHRKSFAPVREKCSL